MSATIRPCQPVQLKNGIPSRSRRLLPSQFLTWTMTSSMNWRTTRAHPPQDLINPRRPSVGRLQLPSLLPLEIHLMLWSLQDLVLTLRLRPCGLAHRQVLLCTMRRQAMTTLTNCWGMGNREIEHVLHLQCIRLRMPQAKKTKNTWPVAGYEANR